MKKTLFIFVLLLVVSVNSQSFQEAYESTRIIEPYANANGTNSYDGYVGNPQEWSKIIGIIGEFDNIEFNKKGLDGSIYLFENWENKGEIQIENRKYFVTNINFNINQDKILMRMEGDSTFVFDVMSTDKFSINGKQFTSVYSSSENKNKIYEVLFKDKDRSLLKGYFLSYIEASPNPMVNRGRNQIKRGHSYFIYENGKLKPFRLKKSSTLNLASSDKSKEIEQYVKSNKLSYKKEKDIVRIFDQISKI